MIFYRESELPPGVYTMETVVHDAPSGKSSVRFSTVEVPKSEPARLRMSSLMLVKRGEKVAEKEPPADNPLLVNGRRSLAQSRRSGAARPRRRVAFYFAVYPARADRRPTSVIELLQNAHAMAQLPMPVPAADAAGRIQQLGRLPLDQLAPGTYELRAIVKQGDEQLFRSTMVRIVE